MPRLKRNQLLAKPPIAEHRLQDTQRFRKLLGRQPKAADYEGVHTTGSSLIAAAYAMSAWRNHNEDGYPVNVLLDVSGLKPLPDVDAMLRGAEAADDLISHYRKLVADGENFWDLLNEDDYRELDAQVGDSPAAFVFEDTGTHVLNAIETYASSSGLDAEEVFEKFLKDGELPPEALTILVNQQRYLDDFDLDRVLRIEAIKPWWDKVLLSWDDDEFQELAARGYEVFTLDEWPFVNEGTTKVVWEAPDAKERLGTGEYHGTTSLVIELAFPGLIPKKTPFPLSGE